MVNDTPDFGDTEYIQSTSESTAHLDVDLGDLLAELETLNIHQANIENATIAVASAMIVAGVPLRYKSGVPIFIENWEYNQKAWYGSSSGTDGITRRSDEAFWSKGWSYELRCSSDSTRRATVSVKQGSYKEGKLGLQFAFTFHQYTDYIRVELYLIGPDSAYQVEFKIDFNNHKVQILDGGNNLQEVITWTIVSYGVDCWHFIKIIVDTENGLWDTIYFNSEEEDISEHTLKTATASDLGYVWMEFNHYGEEGQNAIMYLDDVCLTDES